MNPPYVTRIKSWCLLVEQVNYTSWLKILKSVWFEIHDHRHICLDGVIPHFPLLDYQRGSKTTKPNPSQSLQSTSTPLVCLQHTPVSPSKAPETAILCIEQSKLHVNLQRKYGICPLDSVGWLMRSVLYCTEAQVARLKTKISSKTLKQPSRQNAR